MGHTLVIKNMYKIRMFFEMIILKALYIYVVSLLLPWKWELWSFDKNINYNNIYIEAIPFLIVLCVYLAFYRRNTCLSFLSTLLFIMYFIPNNSCLTLSSYDLDYYFLNTVYSLFVFVMIGVYGRRENSDESAYEIDQNYIWNNKRLLRIMSVASLVVCVICIVYVYLYNGLNFAFLFSDMYTTRAEFADFYASHTNSVVSYAILVVTAVFTWILPLCLYYALRAKKIGFTILCIFTYIALYTVQQTKSTLFMLALIFFISFISGSERLERISEIFIGSFILVFIVCILEKHIYGHSIVFTMFLRRLLYLPQYLVHTYYEFFSTHAKLWFTQDVFLIQNFTRALFGSAYPQSAISTISSVCYGGGIPSPNTGMFAEAYAQLGDAGIFVFPVILAFIGKKLNDYSSWYGKGAAMIIMAKYSLVCVSIQLLVSSTFVGFVFFIVISIILKYSYQKMLVVSNSL